MTIPVVCISVNLVVLASSLIIVATSDHAPVMWALMASAAAASAAYMTTDFYHLNRFRCRARSVAAEKRAQVS